MKKTKNASRDVEKKVEKIFALRSKGLTNAQIGQKVGLSPGGVSYHLNK